MEGRRCGVQPPSPKNRLDAVPADLDDSWSVVQTTDADRIDNVLFKAGGTARHAAPSSVRIRLFHGSSCRSGGAPDAFRESGSGLRVESGDGIRDTGVVGTLVSPPASSPASTLV